MELAKVLPYNLDFEKALLGICILEGKSIYEIVDIINTDMFYDIKHQTIYKHLVRMFREGVQIDLLSLGKSIMQSNEKEVIGGLEYLSELTNRISSSANIEYYAVMIKEYYIKRSIITFSAELNTKAYYEAETLDSLVEYIDKRIFEITNYCYGKSTIEHVSVPVTKALEEIHERIQANKSGKPLGIPTPITKLNNILNGGYKTGLHILAARPAMGKTSLMLSIAKMAVHFDKIPLIFSLEMTNKQLADRLILSELDDSVQTDRYRNGWMDELEFKKVVDASLLAKNMNMYFDDNSCVSFSYIKSTSYKKKKQGACDIIFIDYLQLMDIKQERGNTRDMAIGNITRQLKSLSKELDVPIILLSQLNRSSEENRGKIPTLSNLRESGNIEQDADSVLFIHRPEYYDETEEKGHGKLIMAKHRNGATGVIDFYYNNSLTKIFNEPINSFDYNAEF